MSFRELYGSLRTLSVLPTAGAEAFSIAVNQYLEISLLFAYTRGGANGAFTYTTEFSIDGSNWYRIADKDQAVIAAGVDNADKTQRSNTTYKATGPAAELFVPPPIKVQGNIFRVIPLETGNIGAPGSLSIQYYIRGDS